MTRRFQRESRIVPEQVNELLYLCDREKREVFVLNRYAAAVWQQLSQPRSIPELTNALGVQFVDSDGTLEGDVSMLVSDLESRGIVHVSKEDGGGPPIES